MSQNQVNVTDLEVPQLVEVKKQLDEELSHLTSSFAQLNKALGKFRACIENVAEVKLANKDKSILVPLTSSLYVPGKLSDLNNVLVDVGTGYYVQKTRAEATKHYEQKADFVKKNLETLQDSISKKQENVNLVVNLIQSKMQQPKPSEP